jgi:hypothetical protein
LGPRLPFLHNLGQKRTSARPDTISGSSPNAEIRPAIASRAEPWFELAVGMRVAFSSFKIDYVFGVKADIAQSVGNTRPER